MVENIFSNITVFRISFRTKDIRKTNWRTWTTDVDDATRKSTRSVTLHPPTRHPYDAAVRRYDGAADKARRYRTIPDETAAVTICDHNASADQTAVRCNTLTRRHPPTRRRPHTRSMTSARSPPAITPSTPTTVPPLPSLHFANPNPAGIPSIAGLWMYAHPPLRRFASWGPPL